MQVVPKKIKENMLCLKIRNLLWKKCHAFRSRLKCKQEYIDGKFCLIFQFCNTKTYSTREFCFQFVLLTKPCQTKIPILNAFFDLNLHQIIYPDKIQIDNMYVDHLIFWDLQ